MTTVKSNEVGPQEIGLNLGEVEKARSLLGTLGKNSGTYSLPYSGEFPISFELKVSGTPPGSFLLYHTQSLQV